MSFGIDLVSGDLFHHSGVKIYIFCDAMLDTKAYQYQVRKSFER